MAEFALPKHSKIVKGIDYPLQTESEKPKTRISFFSLFDSESLSGTLKRRDERTLCVRKFVLSNQDEVVNMRSYLRTKFARFCLSISKVTVHLYINRYIQNVVVPPLDREWDDQGVYDYFGITEDERKYIDSFIPNFYQ